MPRIELDKLQFSVAEDFKVWAESASAILEDVPIPTTIIETAKAARKRIMYAVRAAIPSLPSERQGLYLFARLDCRDTLSQIIYIGLVKGSKRSLYTRMCEHLANEISSLDPSLYLLPDRTAEQEIRRRIRSVLPQSEKLESYCRKHLKARKMSQANVVLLFPVTGEPTVIEQAETALIQSAMPREGESRLFVNKMKTKRDQKPSTEGVSIAQKAINEWRRNGLGRMAATEWLNRLETQAQR